MKTKFLLVLLAIMLPLLVNAQTYYDVEVNGIYYKLNNETKEATVVANTGKEGSMGWFTLNPSYSGNLIIPETVTSGGNTYTVTKIDGQVRGLDYFSSRGAFEGCKNLTSITIPKSVKSVGHHAFDGCTSLNAVYISDMTAWCNIVFDLYDRYGNYFPDANPLYYAHSLYLNGNLISDLIIPDDITKIGAGTFIGSNIKSVTIPKTVSAIGSYAFDACDNLNDVYIYSKGISSIDDINSFKYVENKTLHIRERYKDYYFLNKYINGGIWLKFAKVEYIEGVDFHIIYKVDNEEYKDIWYEVGESITPEVEPTKEGYSFSGWSEIPETMPDHDVTVTGTFSPNTYKLTYIVDGEEYKVAEVKCDAAITAETCPTKKGMTFSGWSDIPETMSAKDVTITGTFSWSKSIVDNVIYEVSDTINNYCKAIGNESASGAIKIAEAVDFDYSYSVSTIADNTFNGCKGITTIDMPATIVSIGERAFANIDKLTDVTIWAEELPETDRTAFENSYIEDYVTLHVPGIAVKKYKETAPWKNFKEIVVIPGTEVVEKYKLTYMVDGEEYKVVEINEGEAVTPEEVPTKEGYTFSGWTNIPETMPGEDVTVSGTFTINKYKLVYMVDGQEYKTYDVEYSSAIDAEAAPTKEGYTFSGWSEIPETMPAKDVTVSGTFTVNKYKLTYTVDGESYKEYEVEYGSSITAESEPTKEGYTFSGWSDIPGTMPANDVTVTGSFTINKYTITYYVDGEVYKTYEIEYGSEISQEADPEKEGYDFSGWSWTPSKMPAEDVTVTGSFTKASYDVNGAKYEINDDGMTLSRADGASGDVVLDATVTINGKTYRITVIGEGAFEGNNNITSLTVPDGINTIMPNAFNGCGNLMKLILGKDVRYIGGKAFANIGSASARRRAAAEPLVIECEAEYVPDADSDAFYGVDTKSAILKVNDELVNFYKTTSPWSSFSNIYGFSDTSSINGIFVNEEGAAIFSIDGRRLDTPQKGLNIIRTDKGVKKLYRK